MSPARKKLTHIDGKGAARIVDVGATPNGHRRIATVSGGTFKGERMNGTVQAPPGGDWILVRTDGTCGDTSIDFGEVGPDGRLVKIAGFFGAPPPLG